LRCDPILHVFAYQYIAFSIVQVTKTTVEVIITGDATATAPPMYFEWHDGRQWAVLQIRSLVEHCGRISLHDCRSMNSKIILSVEHITIPPTFELSSRNNNGYSGLDLF
jgi:hypothetical protein